MESETNDDILPPLYCNPGDFGQNQLFLDWILEKSCSTMMGNTKFQLFSLPALLYCLYNSSQLTEEEEEGRKSQVPSLVVAETQLNRNTFMYQTDTCLWHSEGQPGRYYCCKATVLAWSYILLSLVCPLHSLPLLENSHYPYGYSDPQLTRSSVKSSVSLSDIQTSETPSTTSSVFGGSQAASEAGVSQISAASSSYKQGSYSRTGSLASQVRLWFGVSCSHITSLWCFRTTSLSTWLGEGGE